MRTLRRLVCLVALGSGACGDAHALLEPPGGAHPPPSQPLPRVVPRDARPLATPALAPPPISGGTLLVTRDSRSAVAADPDRDRVTIADLGSWTSREVVLERGDEPGRAVEDAQGRVHVVLRGAGAVASLDLAAGSVIERRAVCPEPRGIDLEPVSSDLLVACAGGELVRLAAAGGAPSATVALDVDLRDVIATGADTTLVSRFRSAEVLRLDASARAIRSRPADQTVLFGTDSELLFADAMAPDLAYRLRRSDDGSLLMLHQVARASELPIGPTSEQPELPAVEGSYAEAARPQQLCRGVVQVAMSRLDAFGVIQSTVRIPGTLAVDVAGSYGSYVAIALPGALTDDQPVPANQSAGPLIPVDERLESHASVLVFDAKHESEATTSASAAMPGEPGCLSGAQPLRIADQVTALAFVPNTTVLVAQSREPARLFRVDVLRPDAVETLELGGPSALDTGHELFHRNAGSGMACASCHGEGGDDGHTWRFVGLGPRRTQSLHVGLAGTAPFHWQGDEQSFQDLVNDVMLRRMGGAELSVERIAALEGFVYELRAPKPRRATSDVAAQRGKVLFQVDAECGSCHSGPTLSDGKAYDVGKEEPLQVPSLVGVGYRTPLMHDGCAPTLRQRFDPSCGGARHGKTEGLDEAQLADLIAYLETL